MRIISTDSSELGNFEYVKIQQGVYSYQPGGRILFVDQDESALLVIRNNFEEKGLAEPVTTIWGVKAYECARGAEKLVTGLWG